MSDNFKRKLEAYEKGELTEAEMEEMERELEKLESYNEFLEEEDSIESKRNPLDEGKQKKILTYSKWKARIQTTFTLLGFLLLITIVSTFLTAIYYSWGKPDRVDVYRNIIDHTLTITNPYGHLGGTSSNSKPFFQLEATRDMKKRVGNENIIVGEMKVNFIFSLMGIPERNNYGRMSQNSPAFIFPGVGDRGMADWKQLEELPEGTVVSAYVSFSQLAETKEVSKWLNGKDIDILWYAVDTGIEEHDDWYDGIIFDPIGFPDFPIWHDDDMILGSREEEKGFLGSKIVSESYSSPEYRDGETSKLHTQFMKTLYFLQEYESKANKLVFGKLRLEERINYLNENGIKHYGAVITGPTKEILTLQEEEWVSNLEVDEVAFWNWD